MERPTSANVQQSANTQTLAKTLFTIKCKPNLSCKCIFTSLVIAQITDLVYLNFHTWEKRKEYGLAFLYFSLTYSTLNKLQSLFFNLLNFQNTFNWLICRVHFGVWQDAHFSDPLLGVRCISSWMRIKFSFCIHQARFWEMHSQQRERLTPC